FTLIVCLASINLSLFAQQGEDSGRRERFERFQKERTEFITKKMQLTEEENKLFWPLCNELQMKKFEANKVLREEMYKLRKAQRENTKISDADYRKIIELGTEIKLKEAQLEKEYYTKFLQIIPAEKVYLYQKAEQEFGRQMMEQRKKN
ncbi:MAG: hypothetical protein LIO93_08175, partial [Bacteroidales bacterium]|nr:hypothetical protein [Bacteroidales bacterium]